jgi:uncharacterized damage-inducible protein DinB
MLETLRKIFEYDGWALDRSIETVEASDHGKAADLITHVVLAEKIWLLRLRGEDSSAVAPFQDLSLRQAIQLASEIHLQFAEYLRSLTEADLHSLVTYKNTKGVEFTTPVLDILLHVGLHSTYHRGQIAWLVRDGGGTAVNTDYITFTRL